jgi:hypothetical protein
MKSWLNPSEILILNGPKKGGAYTSPVSFFTEFI